MAEWYHVAVFCFASFCIGMLCFSWLEDRQSKVLKRLRQLDAKDADEYIAKLKEEIDGHKEYKTKYEALTAELNDMAKKYPLFKPFHRVVDAKQQGVKFEKDELCGLIGFKIKDEEGGV